jgi:tetratricopeptide (TPR) repeat protein
LAVCAEFLLGTSLAIDSAHPVEAEYHLREAERLLRDRAGSFNTKVTSLQIKYQLGTTLGQQGRNEEAFALYREVLELMERGEGTLDAMALGNIMLYNHLAYYAHLLGDASADMYAQTGIKLARERESLSILPYLYSTAGEIALANGDLDVAEKYFRDGLTLAEQMSMSERIAGMTANLGRVAKDRGDNDLAREQLERALSLVTLLENHHLEVRIRIWLAPLLAADDARTNLRYARVVAEQGGLNGLLEEIGELEKGLP